MIKSKSSIIVDYVIAFICLILMLICIIPVLSVLSRSLSDPAALMRREVFLLPVGFTLEAYARVLTTTKYTWAIAWTAMLTVMGVALSLLMTTILAYPLTFEKLKGRKLMNAMAIFTMYFGAGTIPMYLLLKEVGLLNTWPVLLVPYCLSIFNMIIMRSFIYGIPESLRESAEIDGAGPILILIKIILPLCKPVLATLALFYAVGRWNGYSDALYFLTSKQEQYFPIQLLLYQLIRNLTAVDPSQEVFIRPGGSETIRMAAVMIATIPILCIYPFLQRYFVAGVTLGAIKE